MMRNVGLSLSTSDLPNKSKDTWEKINYMIYITIIMTTAQ
jgi:hypothetical protein